MTRRPLILAIDASVDTLVLMRDFFEAEGYEVATLELRHLREGPRAPDELVRAIAPDVVVFDVALPYDRNWRMVEVLRRHVPDVPFVITTTNERAVAQQIGMRDDILEIFGKPYDLARVRDAVARALDRSTAERETGDRRGNVDRRAGERRQNERRE